MTARQVRFGFTIWEIRTSPAVASRRLVSTSESPVSLVSSLAISATAPQAAGRIHSDIERGFIRVEVISFDDFVSAGSEKAAKASGSAHKRGRDYVLADGDICHFLFSV